VKKAVSVKNANRLVNTGCVVLVTSKYENKTNIITLAWQSPLSHNPMLLGIAVANVHLSNELIKKSKEFVINVPNHNLIKQTHACGSVSGRKVDKFKENNLSMKQSNNISTPGIKECIVNIECRVEKTIEIGDHTLFVGRTLCAKVEENLFDFDNACWRILPETELLHHLGKNFYITPNKLHRA